MHYFCYSLKPLDIEVMKALHHKVNIVPVIAKADTLTANEVKMLKKKVLEPFLTECPTGFRYIFTNRAPAQILTFISNHTCSYTLYTA